MSQPVRSSALNLSSPWLVETPESFVILDAADAWAFLSPAAPIFIWGFAPIDGSSFIHVTCVTCRVAGEITIRQAHPGMPIQLEFVHDGLGVIYRCEGTLDLQHFSVANDQLLAAPDRIRKLKYAVIDAALMEPTFFSPSEMDGIVL